MSREKIASILSRAIDEMRDEDSRERDEQDQLERRDERLERQAREDRVIVSGELVARSLERIACALERLSVVGFTSRP